LPLLLLLDSELKGTLVVAASVVADNGVPPEVVESQGAGEDVGVVQLVVVADPRSGKTPKLLNGWRAAKRSGLLWLATLKVS
jgi:hypothetical protein